MNHNAVMAARATLAAIPMYAQALAGQVGVNVVFSRNASTASTDGKNITLPQIPLPRDEGDVEAARVLRVLLTGMTAHECGHVAHTDFDVETGSDQMHTFVTAIEDPRQEAVHISRYAGLKGILDDMSEMLIGMKGFYEVLSPKDAPMWQLSAYTMYSLRADLRDQAPFGELALQSRPALVETFGEAFVSRLDVICATGGPKLRSTADSLAMAQDILTAMEEEQERQENAGNQGSQDSDQQGESQEGGDQGQSGQSGDQSQGRQQGASGATDDGAGNGSQSSSDDGQSQQGGPQSKGKKSPKDGQQGGGNGAGGDAGDQSGNQAGGKMPTAAEIARALKDALQDTDNGLKDLGVLANEALSDAIKDVERKGVVGYIYDDPEADIDPQSPSASRATPIGKFDTSQALLYSGQLRCAMQNQLKSMQRRRDHESTRGTTLNQRTLHRTSSGDRRLFLKIDDRKELNTAIMILLDVSSSMNQRIRLAEQACFVMATALNGLSGVSTAVTTFPSYKVVLRFGEKAMRQPDNFTLGTLGTTPMAEAVLWSGRQLAKRREDRKILMVVTDGQPNNVEATKAQLAAAEHHGIETMGIGIQLPAVSQLFAKHGVISSLDELTPTMMSMIGGALRAQLMAA